MRPLWLVVLFSAGFVGYFAYSAWTETTPGVADTAILIRDGNAKKSTIWKTGAYCSVAWYKSIETLLLRRNGTISDSPFKYKWTLYEWGSEQDQKWFDANCKEPPQ